ncbi:SIR2 family protein [Sphingosinicella sp. LY1275]|uniref:SIR2 family protein n=1 Tax=Sphingosinicella sp. LY1275 TaxID=3095379 RepID=UPI002ADEB7F5|nr:SIR2 family protein [Sphingosinicella sp. LY1275]MEA1015161.1 SIR2 family protein [Sphingosinicella sp. LY1275]
MAISVELKTRLLGAIDTDTLIFLCGAGLSMPSPSFLPNAARVAEICYDKWVANEALGANLKYDVDKLAGHFHASNDFESLFIPLVPWNELSGAPNKGHAAVADLLVSRAAHAALSANFDTMIERWAEQYKVAMQGALTGQEATSAASHYGPLLKFHGCMQRGRSTTLWTKAQLTEPAIQARIQSCSQWMNLHLPGRHLVVVGFWTDWGYLNDVLAQAFAITNALSVTVIDPTPSATLRDKAAQLWDKLTTLSAAFEHIEESGDEILEELRVAYSRSWAKRFYALGQPLAAASGITHVPNPDGLEGDDLYNLRRDVEGIPYTRAAMLKAPPVDAAEAAFAHIELGNDGAVQSGAWLAHGGRTVRIVNGAGRGLSDMQEAHKEPPNLAQPDIVLCAGAIDFGVPAKLIASGKGASIVSPAPGGGAKWLTRADARTELGL